MKRSAIFLLFLFLAATFMKAYDFTANYETIVLKDGTIIKGYLKSQNILISKENIPTVDIYVEKIERTIPNTDLLKLVDSKVLLKNVDPYWEKWFKENPKYIENTDHYETVTFTDLIFRNNDIFLSNNKTSNQVKILERGARVKYIDFLHKTITLKSELIAKINYPALASTLISGIYEYIQTKNGMEYQGVVKYLIPDKLICIKTNDKWKDVVNINFSDIRIREKKRCNLFQPIEEQVAFKDLVFKKDDTCISGIICEFNYDKDPKKSSLHLLKEEGESEKIYLNDILRIEREVNNAYLPKKKIELKDDNEVVVDSVSAKYIQPKEMNGVLYFNDIDSTMVVLKGKDINNQLHVYMKANSAYLIRPSKVYNTLEKMENTDLKKFFKANFTENKEEKIYAISFKEILKDGILCTKNNYSDSIIERIYNVNEGDYLLYLSDNDRIYYIRIE